MNLRGTDGQILQIVATELSPDASDLFGVVEFSRHVVGRVGW
ncbi:MAG: hypothetical protein OXB90_06230 [Acidimicrobiaceae bacterium]|nr:hypothetical protein [Acidimicrobiaceae bacterium]